MKFTTADTENTEGARRATLLSRFNANGTNIKEAFQEAATVQPEFNSSKLGFK